MTRRLLDYGSNAVLLECADLTDALSVQPLIKTHIEQITEIIPGARTLLLRLSEPLTPADRKTYARKARAEQAKGFETIRVSYEEDADEGR